MSRTERLLDLVQILRGYRAPVAGAVLADRLGVSLRTLYRDIATLQAQGADIRGEAGLGYVLMPGFVLPPLMFTETEIEALVLGAQWVAAHADPQLRAAAQVVLDKIAAVLPEAMLGRVHDSGVLVGPAAPALGADVDLDPIRTAIRRERRLDLVYRDADGAESRRRIWPIALAYFQSVRMVAAWCELREDFRHFRVDRIVSIEDPGLGYPKPRAALTKAWRRSLADRKPTTEGAPAALADASAKGTDTGC